MLVDSSVVGKELGTISFPIEAGKVLEMARALHDDHPVYRDEAAARAHGFMAIPAPLTAVRLPRIETRGAPRATRWRWASTLGACCTARALGIPEARACRRPADGDASRGRGSRA